MALYALFSANSPHLTTLKNGCFRYFQLGGTRISEPAGLLGGLIRNPWVLVYHFFCVAFWAVWCRVKEVGWVRKPWEISVGSVQVVGTAAGVIGGYLVAEVRR
jgi:squalene monooxygenase